MSKNINKFLTNRTPYKLPIILSFFSILLLTISYPVIDQGYMVWVAFVPWFMLIKTNHRPIFSAILIGYIFFIINIVWLRHVTYAAWLLLSFYSMGYFVIFCAAASIILKKFKNLPLSLIAPLLWVSGEYVRSFLMTGFPWLFIGHTQYKYLSIIQIADITGVYGISFLIILINAAITDLIVFIKSGQKYKQMSFFLLTAVYPIAMVSIVMFYGILCLKNNNYKEGPNVSVVQGNIHQSVKNDPNEIQQVKNLQNYLKLSELLVQEDEKVELVVWPETMAPGLLNVNADFTGRNIDRITQNSIENLAYSLNSRMIIGSTAIEIEHGEQTFYNSAFYIDNEGFITNRYDKIHLVPFGEYTPLKKYFPFLTKLVPYEVSLSHGKKKVTFDLICQNTDSYKFGVLICYEDTVPTLVREFVNEGVDFMVNITNDGWFGKSAELDQHLAIMVFRAVENRVGMVRAANTGISAFININGYIYDKLKSDNGEYKEVEGTLTNKVMVNGETTKTWYTKNGDIFAIICLTMSCIILLCSVIKYCSNRSQ